MAAVPFRSGREGLYANIGDSTFLVRRTRRGFVACINGQEADAPRSTQKSALSDAQRLASAYVQKLLLVTDDHVIVLGEPNEFATHLDANGRPTAVYHDGDRDYPYHPTPCCGAAASINDGPMFCKACYHEVDDWYGGVPADPIVPLASSENQAEGEATTPEIQEDPMTTTTDKSKAATTVKTAAQKKAAAARAAKAKEAREAKAAAKAKADAATARSANRAAIKTRYGKGEKVAEIATALGISQGRVRQILMDEGLVTVTSRNPERDARIVAAMDAGEKPADIAAREGVKEFRVRWIYKVAKAGAA